MKQTKAELLQKLAWLDGTAQRLSKDNAALSSRLLSRVLSLYSIENKLTTAERERDNFKKLLDEERDEVSRLRGLLADRIEYDRMRPPTTRVTYCIDARSADAADVEKRVQTALVSTWSDGIKASAAALRELRRQDKCL